VSVVLVKCSW